MKYIKKRGIFQILYGYWQLTIPYKTVIMQNNRKLYHTLHQNRKGHRSAVVTLLHHWNEDHLNLYTLVCFNLTLTLAVFHLNIEKHRKYSIFLLYTHYSQLIAFLLRLYRGGGGHYSLCWSGLRFARLRVYLQLKSRKKYTICAVEWCGWHLIQSKQLDSSCEVGCDYTFFVYQTKQLTIL